MTATDLPRRHRPSFGRQLSIRGFDLFDTPPKALPIAITYVVPFLVSLASSVIALRLERRSSAVTTSLLEREIAAINRFPGQNPNPVTRITEDGLLTYANASSAPVRAGLGVEVGGTLDETTLSRIRAAAAATPPETFEVTDGRRTFEVLSVHIPELGAYNVYGTDITAAKVVARFPDRNTNPVLRMSPAGKLTYANAAGLSIVRGAASRSAPRSPTGCSVTCRRRWPILPRPRPRFQPRAAGPSGSRPCSSRSSTS
jgi:hypothetical protein